MNGVDWNALAQSRREQILSCSDPAAFEKEVHKLVAELKTSHTGFRHAGMRNIPARHAINATLQRIGVNGTERWMFQDVHQGGPAYIAGIRPGDLLLPARSAEPFPRTITDEKLSQAPSITRPPFLVWLALCAEPLPVAPCVPANWGLRSQLPRTSGTPESHDLC